MSSIRMEAGTSQLAHPGAGFALAKRLLDIGAATAGLVICLPLMALTAVSVYFALGRPLMFGQQRAGKAMHIFHISKFRTMTDARDDQGNLLPDDQRQTPLTVFLRRIRVDELPQLFAVLRGEMSLIGPRPLPASILANFGEVGQLRCSVRPGMTGWAQVNGNTKLTDEQKMALDIWYVDHHDFWLDLRILFLTVRTILLGESIDKRNLERAQSHLARRGVSISSPAARS